MALASSVTAGTVTAVTLPARLALASTRTGRLPLTRRRTIVTGS